MRSNFPRGLEISLGYEGGKSNHPKDPGGLTYRGVTQRTYDAYRKMLKLPKRSVLQITDEEIKDLYRRQYWQPIKGDELPAGIDIAVFDYAINSGPGKAAKDLQRLVGVKADGIIGAQTLAAVHEAARQDEESLIAKYCDMRMAFLKSLRHWDTFGKGWKRRVMGKHDGFQADDLGVIDYAIRIARRDYTYGTPTPVGTYANEAGPAKAPPEGVNPAATPEAVGGGLATIGTVVLAVRDAVEQLMPVADAPGVKYVIVAVVLAGLGFAAYGFVRRMREQEA